MKENDSTVQGKTKHTPTYRQIMQPKNHKKTNSRPNRAVWTVFVNCAHWRGSTLAIYKTVLITFPLNLQTITITLDVVKWRWGGVEWRLVNFFKLHFPTKLLAPSSTSTTLFHLYCNKIAAHKDLCHPTHKNKTILFPHQPRINELYIMIVSCFCTEYMCVFNLTCLLVYGFTFSVFHIVLSVLFVCFNLAHATKL